VLKLIAPIPEVQTGSGKEASPGTDPMETVTHYPGRLIDAASIRSVRVSVVTWPVPSNDMIHGPIYLPSPLIHAQNFASRHNGDVSYTYTGILSSQISGSDTILCEKNMAGQRVKVASPNAPPLNTPLVIR